MPFTWTRWWAWLSIPGQWKHSPQDPTAFHHRGHRGHRGKQKQIQTRVKEPAVFVRAPGEAGSSRCSLSGNFFASPLCSAGIKSRCHMVLVRKHAIVSGTMDPPSGGCELRMTNPLWFFLCALCALCVLCGEDFHTVSLNPRPHPCIQLNR